MWGDTLAPEPERQLQAVVVQILRFCTTTLRLADQETELPQPVTGLTPLKKNKVVAECSLLARTTTAIPAPTFELTRLSKTLVAELEALARPETLPVALCFDPAGTPEHAFAHVQLSCLGSADPAIDELLIGAWEARESRGLERSTLDEIESTWLKAIWLGDWPAPFGPELLGRSALGRPLDVLRAHPATSYEFTHAVMQISDLGSWRVALPRPQSDLIADVEALLVAALAARNYDLVAELLWTWPMLQLPWTELSTRAFALLLEVQSRCGFLPGPDFCYQTHGSLGAAAAARYAQLTSYHTTLVLGMLCGSILSADWLPDAAVPWEPETTADSAYAVTVALQQAWRHSDITDLRGALANTVAVGQARGPVVAQALGVLQRAATAAELHARLSA